MSWQAQYSDGTSPALHAREVCIGDAGLDLHGGSEIEHWAWSDLFAIVPLEPGAPVRLGHRVHPARLRIDDPQAAATLLAAAPSLAVVHRAQARTRGFSRGVWIRLAAAVAVFVFAIAFGPELIAGLMPQAWATRIGDRVLETIAPESKRCRDADALATARELAARIDPDRPIRIEIASLDQPNAVSLPGGRIVLGRELLTFTETPDELAFVLAHELAHQAFDDPLAGFVRAHGISALFQAMTGGSGTLSNTGIAFALPPMSQRVEARADRTALQLLARAGLRRDGVASFWKRFEQRHADAPSYFATHPPTAARAAAAASSAHDGASALEPDRWKQLRRACGG